MHGSLSVVKLRRFDHRSVHKNEIDHRWWSMHLDNPVVKLMFCLISVVKLRRVDHRWWGAHLDNPVVKNAVSPWSRRPFPLSNCADLTTVRSQPSDLSRGPDNGRFRAQLAPI